METPVPHRFKAREFHRLIEVGVLGPDARVELLDGHIFDVSPLGPLHDGVVDRLARLFVKLSNARWLVWPHGSLLLDEHSEPQPDLVLLKPSPDDYAARPPLPDDIFLLIEVADSSLDLDREEKLPVYARAGIREVWIVNLPGRVMEVYREPDADGYTSKTVLRSGTQAKPQAFPDVGVDVAGALKI